MAKNNIYILLLREEEEEELFSPQAFCKRKPIDNIYTFSESDRALKF